MSWEKKPPPLRLRPRPSPILGAFLLGTHAVALAVVLALDLERVWRAALCFLVLADLAYEMGVHFLFLVPWAVREAIWTSDGSWILTLVSGKQIEVRLLPSTFVAPGLLVLNFRHRRWRLYHTVLFPGALDADLLRRLRVRLRLWGAGGKSTDDFF